MKETIYWYGTSMDTNLPFRLNMAGETSGENYFMERKNAVEYTFAYVRSGIGEIFYEGEKLIVKKGDCFLLHINSNHDYHSDDDDPFDFLWVNVSGVLVSYLIQAYGLEKQIIIPNFPAPYLFNEFLEICRNSDDEREITSLGVLKLHEIILSLSENIKEKVSSNNIAYKVKALIDKNLNHNLTIKDIAANLGYSGAHINRTFKRTFNQTPYQYLLENKLFAAKKILKSSKVKIKQVSEMFGFSDEFHFSNAFYKQFGYRPKKISADKKNAAHNKKAY